MNETTDISAEQRISILLDLLDPEASSAFLDELPVQRGRQIRQQLKSLRESPPSEEQVDQVLDEFERVFRFALNTLPNLQASATSDPAEHSELRAEDLTNLPTDDPFEDLQLLSSVRLAAALRGESPRAIALVLDLVPEDRAALILQSLPEETRNATFMQIRERPTAPQVVLARLAQAAVSKGLSIDEKELGGDVVDADEKMARMLRSMERKQQAGILENIGTADAEAAARIRALMFKFEDLARTEDRSLQQLLGEVDSRTLALSLHEVDTAIQEKIMHNLSRRARETLEEELELLGSVPEEDVEEARTSVVNAMTILDEKGELRFTR